MPKAIIIVTDKTRICKNCGKEFFIKRYYYERGFTNSSVECCCKKCAYEYAKVKRNKTNLERYSRINVGQFGTEENKKAIIEKYGVENVFQSDVIKEKIKKTNIERYGDRIPIRNMEIQNKVKQTNLERYDVENVLQNEEIMNRAKLTKLKKYGAESILQSDIWLKNNMAELQRKRYNTMKKNHTFNTSKCEQKIKKLLFEKFSNVQTEYKSEKYPFACDFYIPDLDLYIEYQGHQSHGKEPFNSNKQEHLDLIKHWTEYGNKDLKNGKKISAYFGYINVYTKRDPLKRQTAIKNNLNWIEFFNMKEFMDWYENLEINNAN